MKNKRILLSTLVMSMAFAAAPALAADFVDMPDDYSTSALEAAVDNGLLNGDGDTINPDGDLTRGEFAAIMVRAFGAVNEADLSDFDDVHEDAWYAEYIAKAVAMGIMEGSGSNINPTDPINRQEVCTVLARAFSMTSSGDIDGFTDSEDVSSWALESVAAMVDAGYIQGSNGAINPTANILRKDFAVIIDRMVAHYATSSDSLADYVEGSVVILSADVLVEGMTITGDLIVADGVDLDDLDLSGVTVTGDIIIRSAGDVTLTDVSASSVKVTAISEDTTVTVAGESTISTVTSAADGATVVVTDDATVSTVETAGTGATVEISGSATVDAVAATGDSATITVADDATVETVEVAGSDSSVEISGSATVETVTATGDSASVSVADDATVAGVEVAGDDSSITVADDATVTDVAVSGSDSTVEVSDNATVDSVVADGSGATVSGDGSVGSVEVNADDATIDTAGTDVSVSDDVSGTTADGDSVAAGESTSTSTSTSTSSSSSSSSGSSYTYYYVTFDDLDEETTDDTVSKVRKGYTTTLPTAPTKEGSLFMGWNTQADGTGTMFTASTTVTSTQTVYPVWVDADGYVDEIIKGGIEDVNGLADFTYAQLSYGESIEDVTVYVYKTSVTVVEVYEDIIGTLLDALQAQTDYVTTLEIGDATMDIATGMTGTDIYDFVKVSGLTGDGSDGDSVIQGVDVIGCLDKQDVDVTVVDINDGEHTYTITFKTVTIESGLINEIINGGIEDVNELDEFTYAKLSELNDDDEVTVTVYDKDVQVTEVYTDIIGTLVDALGEQSYIVYELQIGEYSMDVTKSMDANDIKAFVMASGLTGDNSDEILGTDTIGELDEQSVTITVVDANGATYDYTVTFANYDVIETDIDTIISTGITTVNDLDDFDYATLSDLGTDGNNNKVTVTISNGTVTVTEVYNDIIQTLLEALQDNSHLVDSVSVADGTPMAIDATITVDQIQAFVKESGLTGANGAISGTDTISCLYNESIAVTVTDVDDTDYTYTVYFEEKSV